jgi:lysophospholipase
VTSLLPNQTLPNEGELGAASLSSDTLIMENRLQDPLIKSQVTFHWLREFIKARKAAFCESDQIRLPMGIFQAGDERVVSRPETERFFQKLSTKKNLKIYEGLRHEIVNEVKREDVMSDILQWIEHHK